MLQHLRVVDLTDERGQLAAFMLAGLGADVVLVEPPGGSRSRRLPPFAHDVDDGEHSLTFWGWNRGKRSVVVDPDGAEGAARLAALAQGADVVIASEAFPVDLAALRAADPRLVTISITAFGESGPKASWPATDLTVNAAGCQLAITGDEDRAPVRTAVPQAFLHACADAAAGALVALHERERSGRGQHVSVSALRSVTQATQSYSLAAALGGSDAQRMSGGIRTGGLDVQLRWPCADGHVSVTFLFGASMGPFTRRLMEWIHEEGGCDEATRDKDWMAYTVLLLTGEEPISEYERLKRVIGAFCATKTKDELLAAAVERSLLIAPVATPADVLGSEQFAARNYFDEVDDELFGGTVLAPGNWVHPSRTWLPRLPRAPRLGEHTDEVLAQTTAAPAAPSGGGSTEPRERPLAGIKVLDLTWAMAGPATTRVMADFGAEVIRVENAGHLDVARTVGPFVNDVPGNDASGLLFNMTAGKRSISLNLRTAEGRSVLDDLVRWADVVVESFSPRGRAVLGLEYDDLTALNPDLVMMSSCLFGQTGPMRRYAGFGTMGASLAGFFHLTGWDDRAPCGPFGAYSDYPSPRFALCALLAALDHRRRTGEGQYLDFAQAEACVHFLTPLVLEQAVNGRTANRVGNRDPAMAPHGVYRSAGDDEWVAVACRDDADWARLAGVLGRDDLAELPLAARVERHDELDALIAAWTVGRAPDDATAELIAAGVPAHTAQNSSHLLRDAQFAHDGHFVELPHAEHGTIAVEDCRIKLDATPAVVDRSPPVLGQDTVDVLTDVLGYDDERLGDLFVAGALE